MPSIGPLELIIVLVIVVVVFGIGRLPEVGGGLGKGIREFRRSLTGQNDDDGEDSSDEKSGV
jgi:sec-independent protein translocase protein TatA